MPDPARLVLSDGVVFRGHAFGARGVGAGEVVFNTSIAGYQEILSDPSYAGQIVVMTYTQIGNVGTNPEDDEAVRDLCRCREDAKEDLMRSRHRLSKMLLRRGLVYRAGRNWTKGHQEWLGKQRFERSADQAVFDDYRLAIEHLEESLVSGENR
ncbi:MAG: hypothetical protein IH789_09805 [Acidobacteria bacterium]|nr:hypothetical protein [Acidobacteriota bacterium]